MAGLRLIDADKLCEYANNQKDHSVTANDIMRFPRVCVPIEGLWQWIHDEDHQEWYCGHCGTVCCYDVGNGTKPSLYGLRYCPFCGAKMEVSDGKAD